MSWLRSGLVVLIDLRHCFSPNLLTNQSLPFKLLKLHQPTLHQLVQSRLLHLLSDLPPTNQPVQICLATPPHRDRSPANRLRLLSRKVLLLQTCPGPTTLYLRGSILASRLKYNPTLADLQICLAPALLLYIRLPANRPQHRLGIRVCLQWIQIRIVTCLTNP